LGSFNTTCFASQQTIAPGDECLVWPIIQNAGYSPVEVVSNGEAQTLFGVANSVNYPSRFWTPFGCLISAKYEDYGQVCLVDTETNRLRILHWLCTLFAQNVIVNQGENECHDIDFDFRAKALESGPRLRSIFESYTTPGLSSYVRMPRMLEDGLAGSDAFEEMTALWEYAWERIQEHRLFGYNHHGELRPVQFSIMHRAAYDRLIALTEEGKTWSGNSLERRLFLEAAVRKGLEVREVYLAEGTQTGDIMARSAVHCTVREELGGAGTHPGIFFYPEIHELDRAMWEQVATGAFDGKGLVDRLHKAVDTRYVLSGLERLNQHLSPMVYAGQDYSNEMGQDYTQFVSQICEAVTAQRERD
jgi:hypothetical protein